MARDPLPITFPSQFCIKIDQLRVGGALKPILFLIPLIFFALLSACEGDSKSGPDSSNNPRYTSGPGNGSDVYPYAGIVIHQKGSVPTLKLNSQGQTVIVYEEKIQAVVVTDGDSYRVESASVDFESADIFQDGHALVLHSIDEGLEKHYILASSELLGPSFKATTGCPGSNRLLAYNQETQEHRLIFPGKVKESGTQTFDAQSYTITSALGNFMRVFRQPGPPYNGLYLALESYDGESSFNGIQNTSRCYAPPVENDTAGL